MTMKTYYEDFPVSGAPEQVVILLHGVGSNGKDLISLAPLWRPHAPRAVFVSPDAPFVCDMVPPGYPDSYQWFSLLDRDPPVLLAGLRRVFPLVETFIEERLAAYGVGYDKLALVGFSQGTMTSLHVAPRLKQKIAGVLGYSGALLDAGVSDIKQKPPIHLIHGEADDVVPVQAWHYAKNVLEQEGFPVSGYTAARLHHSIDAQGVEDGGAFLKKVLGA
jgi:phospholipase/carboxylesterase